MNRIARLKKERDAFQKNLTKDESIAYIRPTNDSLMQFEAQIRGPEESAYKGYEFRILLDISKDYPISPLTGKFDTKIFHPNVKWDTGEICLDIFKKEWSPAWDIITSCRAIVALLADPAPDSPLNCDAGNMLREKDTRAFQSMARMFCRNYAIPSPLLSMAASPSTSPSTSICNSNSSATNANTASCNVRNFSDSGSDNNNHNHNNNSNNNNNNNNNNSSNNLVPES